MQNPRWQNPDSSDSHFEDNSYQPYSEIEQRRGTLGQFIERSTSAPPSSSAFFGKPNEDKFASKGDSFVGNVSTFPVWDVCIFFDFQFFVICLTEYLIYCHVVDRIYSNTLQKATPITQRWSRILKESRNIPILEMIIDLVLIGRDQKLRMTTCPIC